MPDDTRAKMLAHIIYARSGYELAIEVDVINQSGEDENKVDELREEFAETVFNHYVRADKSVAGEHAVVDDEEMELYYRGMNGRIQIFKGKAVGYFNETVRLDAVLMPRKDE